MTVAETTPLASENDEESLNETMVDGCQTTATLASGLPDASSTRAVSATGRIAPGAPDWLSPLRIRSSAGIEDVAGGAAEALTVKLNTVVTMLLLDPKGVCAVLMVR